MSRRTSAVPRTPTLRVAAVAVLLAAVGCGPRGAAVGEQAAEAPSTSAAAVRTVTWNDLTFAVPARWTVNETHEAWPHPSAALLEGPYLGTLRTGPMCWTDPGGGGGCSRAHGILDRRPTDGVVAWIDAGQVGPHIGLDDPGPGTDACPAGATTFHAYRVLDSGNGRRRVAVDGCAYGPHAQVYLQELRQLAAGVSAA